jgi:hypothetical protein
MTGSSFLLIAVCGALGFGIIWTMIPGRKPDDRDPLS